MYNTFDIKVTYIKLLSKHIFNLENYEKVFSIVAYLLSSGYSMGEIEKSFSISDELMDRYNVEG